MEATTRIVNKDGEDEFVIEGYRKSVARIAIYYLLGIVTAGFFFLLGYWLPEKRTKLTHLVCLLTEATIVIAVQGDGKAREASVCDIVTEDLSDHSTNPPDSNENDFVPFEADILRSRKMRYFQHMFLRYYFTEQGDVHEISGLDNQLTKQQLADRKDGIHVKSIHQKLMIHGHNVVEVPNKPFLLILIQFTADPLYCFQFISVTLWFADDYIYYTTAIVLMTVFSLLITSYETRKQLKKLHDMIGQPIQVIMFRKGISSCEPITKSSSELIPGDIIVIPKEGVAMPCDAILIEGTCVVNESSLTGEGFPVSKTPIDNVNVVEGGTDKKTLQLNDIKQHALFYGTNILQTHRSSKEEYVKAMVLRTGFSTLKGRLIRSIIYPKPIYFKFFRDSMKFIMFLACLGVIGIAYSMTLFILDGYDAFTVIKRGFDVITIIVPPVLPACMSIGLLFAVRRLKNKEIYCTDPQRINLCGKLKLFVFDKTGTLTSDQLIVSGVIESRNSVLQDIEADTEVLRNSSVLKGMACCHSLSVVDNLHVGNPLDCHMFEFTKWNLNKDASASCFYVESPPNMSGTQTATRIDILKEFPFSSSLQRMSVIVKEKKTQSLTAYMKGSPEAVLSFCKTDSHPSNVDAVLLSHTQRGQRVLAIASKQINELENSYSDLSRNEIESELDFLGLIVFENQVKPSTKETMMLLQDGNIRTVMATGDNLHTAAAVAQDVGIIQLNQTAVELSIQGNNIIAQILRLNSSQETIAESTISEHSATQIVVNEYEIFNDDCLAYNCILTGKTFIEIKENHQELLPKVLMSASVYARMSPSDKTFLVEDLKSLGYGVGMCGDGVNDCGALKAAHAGIALSDSEASVAAPFTSKVFDISCVPWLICEGRAALVTSFSIFKYLASYSFIQFFGVLILYSLKSSYSDWEYTYADMALCLLLAMTMIQCGAVQTIDARRPPGRLVQPLILLGFLLQALLILAFQIVAFFLPRFMPWYKPVSEFDNSGKQLNYTCYENYSLMMVSFYQYIWMSLICSTGYPYRVPLYKNHWYVAAFVITTLLTTCIALIPAQFIQDLFQFPAPPSLTYKCGLIVLAMVHLYFAYVTDVFIRSNRAKKLCNKLRGKVEPRNRYKHVHKNLLRDKLWPLQFLEVDEL